MNILSQICSRDKLVTYKLMYTEGNLNSGYVNIYIKYINIKVLKGFVMGRRNRKGESDREK